MHPVCPKRRIAWPFASKAQTTMESWDLGYSWPTGLALACRSATLLTLYDAQSKLSLHLLHASLCSGQILCGCSPARLVTESPGTSALWGLAVAALFLPSARDYYYGLRCLGHEFFYGGSTVLGMDASSIKQPPILLRGRPSPCQILIRTAIRCPPVQP